MRARAALCAAALLAAFPGFAFAQRTTPPFSPALRPSLTAPDAGVSLSSGPAPVGEGPDAPFAAYQRGYHRTAYAEALKRLRAEPGDAAAMAMLGQLYLDGVAVKIDEAEAARWFALSAARGYAPAQFALATMQLDGKGGPKDIAAAKALFEALAPSGHAGALYNLGALALGQEPPDFAAAAEFFRRAAAAGDATAAYSLAVMYRAGQGVERSEAEAAKWMKQAADARNTAGELEYALMLFNGVGVGKDEPGAAKLLVRAANRDNPVAQNRLARLLAAGRGAPKNMVEAMKWHILARGAGVEDDWLDDQLATLTPEQRGKVEEAVRRYLGR